MVPGLQDLQSAGGDGTGQVRRDQDRDRARDSRSGTGQRQNAGKLAPVPNETDTSESDDEHPSGSPPSHAYNPRRPGSPVKPTTAAAIMHKDPFLKDHRNTHERKDPNLQNATTSVPSVLRPRRFADHEHDHVKAIPSRTPVGDNDNDDAPILSAPSTSLPRRHDDATSTSTSISAPKPSLAGTSGKNETIPSTPNVPTTSRSDMLAARINNPTLRNSQSTLLPQRPGTEPLPRDPTPTKPIPCPASASAATTGKSGTLVAKKPSPAIPPDRLAKTDPSRMHTRQAHQHVSPSTTSNSQTGDLDLVTSMASRLNKLEAEIRLLKRDIQTKNSTITKLEQEIQLHQQTTRHHDEHAAKVEFLEIKCRTLASQVDEMESFLARYDMIWENGTSHGGSLGPSRQSSRPVSAASSLHSSGSRHSLLGTPITAFPYEIDRIRSRIAELNIVAGEGVAYVHSSGRSAASLKTLAPLPLSIYRNGLALRSGPFRPFTDKSTKMFMRDLLDGYFPFELKDQFPDGVPFDLRDYHTTFFDDTPKYVPFSGTGHVVGYSNDDWLSGASRPTSAVGGKQQKQPQPLQGVLKNPSRPGSAMRFNTGLEEEGHGGSSLSGPNPSVADGSQYSWLDQNGQDSTRPSTSSLSNLLSTERHARFRENTPEMPSTSPLHLASLDDSPLKKQSKQSFLQKLPRYVVKHGRIVDVRHGIDSLLDGRPTSASSLSTVNIPSAATNSTSPCRQNTGLKLNIDAVTPARHMDTSNKRTILIPTTVDMADRHTARRLNLALAPHPPSTSKSSVSHNGSPPAPLAPPSASSSRPASPTRKSLLGLPTSPSPTSHERKSSASIPSHPTSYEQVTTLKIHAPDDTTEYMVRMYGKQTLKELKSVLDEHVLPVYGEYTLKTSFPIKGKHDVNMTMEECGLVPNAKLYIRRIHGTK
ncbi:hypothetical protein SeMB42_g05541 [Synchytrium endobioticum]|uniref:UBX domain-containing protein 11 n=1 Tax=Synchytrium endobioticum TaxID=286115 RepID=A0A507CQV9_9FUNG|nr:hypothetical protein SeMB42_g05541 [Synchytrium endobioticum]TPX47759.1 hypothetical protein SeLEV6574_g02456 [Synchytrium endobioticum]